MTKEIANWQTAGKANGAVPAGQPASTGGAHSGAESVIGIEISLEKLIALARLKAPIVGMPRPGEKPLALSRSILAGLLTGLTVCQITLTDDLEIHAERRHYRLRPLDMRRGSEHYKSLKAWAVRERKKKATRHLSRDERRKAELFLKIAVAERKAKRMANHCQPYNPTLECGESASG